MLYESERKERERGELVLETIVDEGFDDERAVIREDGEGFGIGKEEEVNDDVDSIVGGTTNPLSSLRNSLRHHNILIPTRFHLEAEIPTHDAIATVPAPPDTTTIASVEPPPAASLVLLGIDINIDTVVVDNISCAHQRYRKCYSTKLNPMARYYQAWQRLYSRYSNDFYLLLSSTLISASSFVTLSLGQNGYHRF